MLGRRFHGVSNRVPFCTLLGLSVLGYLLIFMRLSKLMPPPQYAVSCFEKVFIFSLAFLLFPCYSISAGRGGSRSFCLSGSVMIPGRTDGSRHPRRMPDCPPRAAVQRHIRHSRRLRHLRHVVPSGPRISGTGQSAFRAKRQHGKRPDQPHAANAACTRAGLGP